MPRLILAAITPDNTPDGYYWTFLFPMLLFIVIGGVLYLLFSRPHRRVPARSITLPARSRSVPGGDVARSASVAGGLSVAPGGGTTESHLEPGGVHQAATGSGRMAAPDERGTWQAGAEPGGATAVGPVTSSEPEETSAPQAPDQAGDSSESAGGSADSSKDPE